MTREELMQLNQTAYDAVVKKLFVMEDYCGSVVEDTYELNFNGEVSTVKVKIEGSDAQNSTHTFVVYSKSSQYLGYQTIHQYVFMSSGYTLSQSFANMVCTKAEAYQLRIDQEREAENERAATQQRIELANKLKQFVSSF